MAQKPALMPPSEAELATAQSRLAVAKDVLDAAEADAVNVLQARRDARAEVKNALVAWRELRRQANIVEQFSLDVFSAVLSAEDDK